MLKNSKQFWFAGLFFLSLAIRLALIDYSIVRIIEADGVGYVSDAKAFLNGFDIRSINVINPPLFPIFISLFSWITPDWETAGRMVSIAAGSLVGPLIFLISLAKGNPSKVSVFAGLFAAISPLFVPLSFRVFNDSLNCMFLLVGVWQLIVAFKEGKGKNFFFSGLGFALAYLTRPDSIVPSFFAFMFVVCYLFSVGIKNRRIVFSAFALGYAILAVPYLFFLHHQTGKWLIAGRQIVAQSDAAAVMSGNYEEVNYGLNQDLSLKGSVASRTDTGKTNIKNGLLKLWIEDPPSMLSALLGNLKVEWDVFVSAVPWYIKILTLIAMVFQGRRFVVANSPFFAYISPIFFLYPFFWVDARHVVHFLLPLWLWAAEGVESLIIALKKIKINEKVSDLLFKKGLIDYSLYGAILIGFIFSFSPKTVSPNEFNQLRQKEMGVWISRNTPKDAVVMARWGRLTFYTDRKTVMFPYAEWEEIKRYIKKNGVTHLVVDESFFNIRPQVKGLLLPLFTGSSVSPDDSLSIMCILPPTFFTPSSSSSDDSLSEMRIGGMIIYEVKK